MQERFHNSDTHADHGYESSMTFKNNLDDKD